MGNITSLRFKCVCVDRRPSNRLEQYHLAADAKQAEKQMVSDFSKDIMEEGDLFEPDYDKGADFPEKPPTFTINMGLVIPKKEDPIFNDELDTENASIDEQLMRISGNLQPEDIGSGERDGNTSAMKPTFDEEQQSTFDEELKSALNFDEEPKSNIETKAN